MTSYQDLDWNSLNFVKNHLYRRLANPLNHALGRLLIAEHIVNDDQARTQFRQVTRNLEVALNLIKAWAALIHVHSGGRLTPDQCRYLDADKLPQWVTDHLKLQTEVQVGYKRRIYVHPETFYEALVLMAQLAAALGDPQALRMDDAAEGAGVWTRAIFTPPAGGPYIGVAGVVRRLDLQQSVGRDTLMQVLVLRALLALNGAELRVQTNENTGEQALAVRVPTTPAEQVAVPVELPDTVVEAIQAAADPTTAPETASPLAPVGLGEETDTLIIPPRGFRERLAKITADAQAAALKVEAPEVENKSETLILPPADKQARIAAAADTTPETPEIENKSETLMLPPTDKEARIAAAADAEPDTPAVENRSETLMLPPEDRAARIEEAVPEVPEVENRSETLIVPPASKEARITAAADEEQSGDFIERVSADAGSDDDDTHVVPPPDFAEARLTLRSAGQQEATAPSPPEAQPDAAEESAAAAPPPLETDERMVVVNITVERHTAPESDTPVEPETDQRVDEADHAPEAVEPPDVPPAKVDVPPPAEARSQAERAVSDSEAEGTDDAPGAPHDGDQSADSGADNSAPNAHASR